MREKSPSTSASEGGRPDLSIVVPMWNEAASVETFFSRLHPVLDSLPVASEVVVVDDGSMDDTPALLRAESKRRSDVRVVTLARNYGQHSAVLAGFEAARGDSIVTLDADLQNPPEEIPRILEALRAGHDVVHTYRVERDDKLWRVMASRAVNRVMRRFSGIGLRDFGCMLRGYDRSVVEPMVLHREYRTFIPALASTYARSPVEIPVAHEPRRAGQSTYSLLRLVWLQFDLITSFSVAPLRLLFLLGGIGALLGTGFALFLLVMRLVYGPDWAVSGVFTLFAVVFLFIGAQLIALGLIGEYIGRIYQEVRSRPRYVVRDQRGGGDAAELRSDLIEAAPRRAGHPVGGRQEAPIGTTRAGQSEGTRLVSTEDSTK